MVTPFSKIESDQHNMFPLVGGFNIRNTPPSVVWSRHDGTWTSGSGVFNPDNYRLIVLYLDDMELHEPFDDIFRYSNMSYGLLDIRTEKISFAYRANYSSTAFKIYDPAQPMNTNLIKCKTSDFYEMNSKNNWQQLEVEVYLGDEIIFSLEDKDDLSADLRCYTDRNLHSDRMVVMHGLSRHEASNTFIENIPGGMFYFDEDMMLSLKTTTGSVDRIPISFFNGDGIVYPRRWSKNHIRATYKGHAGINRFPVKTPVIPTDMVFYLDGKRIGETHV